MTEKRTKSLLTIEDAEALLILDEMLPLILDDDVIKFLFGFDEQEFYNGDYAVFKDYTGNRHFAYAALQVVKKLKEKLTIDGY